MKTTSENVAAVILKVSSSSSSTSVKTEHQLAEESGVGMSILYRWAQPVSPDNPAQLRVLWADLASCLLRLFYRLQ